MNRAINALALAGLISGSASLANAAFAEDTMSHATMTTHQAMKDCIEQQKTADVNMSKAAMKRLCKDKLKAQKTTGDMPQRPATDAPHN
jgi:pentapeptide MXKDX repeat protein